MYIERAVGEAQAADMENAVLAGSVAVSNDGCLWYTAGEWGSPNDQLPAILGYVPSEYVPPDFPYLKTIELAGVEYKKAFGLPLDQYRRYIELVSGVSRVSPEQLVGRLALVDRERLSVWRDPKEHMPRFLAHLPRVEATLAELSEIIDVSIDSMGVSGSSLMFDPPVLRHEIDLAVYGIDTAQHAHHAMRELIENGLAAPVDNYWQRFNFKGIEFDPQFFLERGDTHPLQGLEILDRQPVGATTLRIEDITNAIFYPAIFETTSLPLLSFRPGQRGLFASGEYVSFPGLSRVTIRTDARGEQEVYATLDEEKGASVVDATPLVPSLGGYAAAASLIHILTGAENGQSRAS